jgi:hypothetical protein
MEQEDKQDPDKGTPCARGLGQITGIEAGCYQHYQCMH